MTARPWMPFYFSDYLGDTGHLSTVEHGAYLLLIAHYWLHGGLPADETTVARITRMTARQWSSSRDRLKSLFGDDWRHKRIDKEIAKALEKSQVNSANAKRRHSERIAPEKRTDTQLQLQPEKKDAAPDGAHEETTEEVELFRRGKKILGTDAGGLIARLLKSKKGSIPLARAAIEQASTKEKPREYIGAVIRGPAHERHGVNDPRAGIL